MNAPFDVSKELEQFSGRAPVIPLTNAALYPHMQLPLHFSEPRCRQMVSDALKGNGYLAVSLTNSDLETGKQSKQMPSCRTLCLGKVTAEKPLPDGRCYVVLKGLSRAALLHEKATGLPYPQGDLEILEDFYPQPPAVNRTHREIELLTGFLEIFPRMKFEHLLKSALGSDIPLGALCDILADAMKLKPPAAQEVLDESNVDLRSELLLQRLRDMLSSPQPSEEFPPNFSLN